MRAELVIDLDAIVANWRRLAALSAPAVCGAVVKADAYGLGAAQVAPALRAAGATVFFTALAEEAIALRGLLGPDPAIYCFNGACAADARDLAAHAVRPLLNSPAQARAFAAQAREDPLPCGLQLDSGMNRLGMEPAELALWLDDAAALDGLDPRLVMSHLACADDASHPMNAAQADAFDAMVAHPRLRGVPRSLAATGGVVMGGRYRHNLTRPGVGLYGGAPFGDAAPVVSLRAPIVQLRDVAAGETVGYGAAWRASRPSRVATLGVGYADGLIRAMGGGGAFAFAGGRALPVIGRVSMDLLTVDVTDMPTPPADGMLDLLGPGQGVDALAAAAGTIGYEILTSLGSRYARRYVGASSP